PHARGSTFDLSAISAPDCSSLMAAVLYSIWIHIAIRIARDAGAKCSMDSGVPGACAARSRFAARQIRSAICLFTLRPAISTPRVNFAFAKSHGSSFVGPYAEASGRETAHVIVRLARQGRGRPQERAPAPLHRLASERPIASG